MNRLLRFALLVAVLLPAGARAQTVLYPGLDGQALLDAVRRDYRPLATLGYDVARDSLFAWEQRRYGSLTGVYTGFAVVLTPGADPSTDAFSKGINTEHTWPQSMGASVEPSRSDMHHLFPVRDNVNSARNNFPYDEIPDAETDAWYRLDQAQSNVPTLALAEWSERDNQNPNPLFQARFEPREDHKGNAARAVFYYRAMYPERIRAAGSDEFFEAQRAVLLAWAKADPVDAREQDRAGYIATKQRRAGDLPGLNPFLVDSTLARRAFGQRVDVGGGTPVPYASTVWLNEIHYENAGADQNEFVEVAVPAGIDPADVTLTLYNGSSGVVYGVDAAVSAFTPGAALGGVQLYTLAFPPNGLQNGSPDGLALSLDGEVVQFLSYEGVFDATDGPGAGLTSVDIGVAETDAVAATVSLQLRGSGLAYSDFTWSAPLPATPGQLNTGQTFTAVAAEPGAEDGAPGQGSLAVALAGPNPFRSRTAVAVTLAAAAADARVETFDALGRLVAPVYAGSLAAGTRRFVVDGSGLAPGVYVVRVLAGAEIASARIVVMQ